MRSFAVVLFSQLLVTSSVATAMPDIEGTYTCVNGQDSADIEIRRQEHRFTVEGLNSSNDSLDQGLVCANEVKDINEQGLAAKVRFVCNEHQIATQAQIQTKDMQLNSLVAIDKVSNNGIMLSVILQGKFKDDDLDSNFEVECQRH